MASDVLTIKELMEKLGISYPTAKKLITEGKVRANRVGNRWVISKQSVREFLGDKVTLAELIDKDLLKSP